MNEEKVLNATSQLTSEEYEKQLYDLKQLVDISKSLCAVLEFSKLIESIIYVCMCQMRVIGAGMFVLKSFDSDFLQLDNNYNGMEIQSDIDYEIPLNHPIIQYCLEKNTAFTLNDFFADNPQGKDIPQLSSLSPSLVVPLIQKNHLNGILVLGERLDLGDGDGYSDYDIQQMNSIASLSAIAVYNATLIEQTTTDIMTHLKMKHYFYTVLNDKLEKSHPTKDPLSVLMLDIDFFKHFNDEHGHACGDFVLQSVARIILDDIRGNDMAARYGGEEFVVMLYNTNEKGGMQVAERIRKDIEESVFVYEGIPLKVTISIGVSVMDYEKSYSSKQLVEFADKALYYSKRNGRNRVTMATEEIISTNLEEH